MVRMSHPVTVLFQYIGRQGGGEGGGGGGGGVSLLFFTLLNDEVVVATVLFRVYILNVPVAVMRDILPP